MLCSVMGPKIKISCDNLNRIIVHSDETVVGIFNNLNDFQRSMNNYISNTLNDSKVKENKYDQEEKKQNRRFSNSKVANLPRRKYRWHTK